MEQDTVDAIVTDPPYALTAVSRGGSRRKFVDNPYGRSRVGSEIITGGGFMGKTWDAELPGVETWAETLRVLKPGGHLLAFGGTRTFHRLTCAIEDAGFEIRDCLSWLYGSGFPKSLDVSKAMDKRPGIMHHAEFGRELKAARLAAGYTNSFDVSLAVTGNRTGACANWEKYQWPQARWWPALKALLGMSDKWDEIIAEAERAITGQHDGHAFADWENNLGADRDATPKERRDSPATDLAKHWAGWGTALKPAWEPIILARKPLIGTVAANVQQHGTGALNVDGCRIAGAPRPTGTRTPGDGQGGGASLSGSGRDRQKAYDADPPSGRWPANVVLDEEAAKLLDEQSGTDHPSNGRRVAVGMFGLGAQPEVQTGYGDNGGASRFFYTAKADSGERHYAGKNTHPTVKPVDLMRWLCRLVTPKGGLILDPFMGSGSTGVAALAEGFRFIGIEREAEYVAIARKRIAGPLFAEAGA